MVSAEIDGWWFGGSESSIISYHIGMNISWHEIIHHDEYCSLLLVGMVIFVSVMCGTCVCLSGCDVRE